jgi:hypothetical protein
MQIIGYLFPEHFTTTLAMMRFHSHVVELSHVYQWNAVFNMAMDYHNTIRSDSVLVIDAWLHVPEHIVYAYCHAGTVRSSQPRSTTIVMTQARQEIRIWRGLTQRHMEVRGRTVT